MAESSETPPPSGGPLSPRSSESPGSPSPTGLEKALDDFGQAVADLEAQVREANAKIDEKAGRPLWQAIVVGLLLGGAFLTALFVSRYSFAIFVAFLVMMTVIELVGALQPAVRLARLPLVLLALTMIPATLFLGPVGLLWALLGTIAVVVVGRAVLALLDASARATFASDSQKGIFVLSYIPFLASFAVLLRQQEGGLWWLFAAVIIVVVIDTAAYASGLAFGRHKLAPLISPGKTWEGFAGSVVAAGIAGVLLALFMLKIDWWWGIILAVVLVLSATIGDLVESLIKRDLGIKDISSFLPGHGGFLDRLDSVVPSMAVMYVLYQVIT